MLDPLLFRARQLAWDLGNSLLFRPTLLVLGLCGLALALPVWERARMESDPSFAAFEAWTALEPGAAQVVLGTLAGSLMTVVSVVYSILLVALSLASMQFSTRVLAGFMRDRTSQNTLGLLLGSFAYALLVLRTVHLDPPFAPAVAVSVAVALAVIALLALIRFIHHIVMSIQANVLIDRLAAETEPVIDEVFPAEPPAEEGSCAPDPSPAHIPAERSGYVQLVDVERLLALAAERGLRVQLLRPMGHFAPEGAALFAVSPAAACGPEVARRCLEAVDLGPSRTYQQDAEWGIRQIVDIALKALSPAVNDPSTAATCVDHLTRLLLRVARRANPASLHRRAEGWLLVPQPTLAELIDLSYEQIRQYARSDMAVSLRLLRGLHDLARGTRDEAALARIRLHARLIAAAAAQGFAPEDRDELERRLGLLREVAGS